MAVVAEFISVLRKIRDVIYPEVNALYEDSLVLKESIDVGKAEFDADLIQFNTDYSDFNTKKNQVDVAVASAQSSATSANNSAIIATNKSNEIKAITAQSTTGAPGTSASASYNTADGKFTFVIPQGSKGDKGDSFTVNSSGVTASRTLYDNQPTGWSFLDVTTSLLYFKQSNATADWSSGVPFGKGDKGDAGDMGVGITSFTFVSTTDISGLPAKSGATDTYKVTLTNETTFDYNIYNGLDYSQELLDEKLNKDFSTFIDKTTPVDTDIFTIMETSGLIKKLSWANLKNTLFNLGIFTPNISWKSTPITITSWSYATTTITLNVASHSFVAGDYIEISGLTATTYPANGIHLVTSVTATTIVFTLSATPTGTAGVSSATVKGYAIVNGRVSESIGVGQTWQDVTASRKLGITYTNSTGKSIMVSVTSIDSGGNGNKQFILTVNGIIIQDSGIYSVTGNTSLSVIGIVNNGSTYQVSSVGSIGLTLIKYLELR